MAPPKKPSERILIAEDSRTQAERLRFLLEDRKYVVQVTANGREALAAATANPPDIVVSDVNMPEMDGYEFCREFKSTPSLKNIPFILATTMSSPQDVIRGLDCGADNFVIKPYDEESMLSRIRYLLANNALRGSSHVRSGIEIELEGKRHFVTAERHQILDLLISTYSSAVRLSEEAAKRGEQLRNSYETMAVLHRCAENLNRLRSEKEVLDEILERLSDLHFVGGSWIWLADENGEIVTVESTGLTDKQVASLSSPLLCECRRNFQNEKSTLPSNIDVCDHFAGAAGMRDSSPGHASVPLIGEQRALGLLNVTHIEERAFTAEELRVVSAIGNQGASALERAQLHATLEHKVVERTAQLQASQVHLALAQKIGNIGSSAVNLRTGEGKWTEENYRIYGLEPSGKPLDYEHVMSLTHPEDREVHREVIVQARSGNDVLPWDYRIVHSDGAVHWVRRQSAIIERDENGSPLTMLVTHQDITATKKAEIERIALETQLTQSQKMEAVGNLTSGIAHDFNNILAIVIGNLDLLQMEIPQGSEGESLVETAISACLKGSELTKSLLAFSRRQPLQPRRVAVNQLLKESVKMLSRAIGERIDVQLKLGEDLWEVQIDPSLLESALLNMMVNSRDAMPDGGFIVVQTRNTFLDHAYAAQNTEVTPGEYVVLEVSDTGSGMSPEIANRVFEPFFTTKEKGKGTGLGLAMVFGFVKQSGGHIKIYSEVGHGTTIRLYLPRATADATDSSNGSRTQGPIGAARDELILVVEDNAAVRRTVIRQLTAAGYRVIEAENGVQAIERIESDASIHLVFSDVVMPGQMTGTDVVREVNRRWPQIKVLLTSGFPEGLLSNGSKLPSGINLLSKPYRTEDLLRKLRDLLDAN